MNDEQRPPGGHDEPAGEPAIERGPEQPSPQPQEVELTEQLPPGVPAQPQGAEVTEQLPLGAPSLVSYPPPTGSPFMHQPAPAVEPAFADASWDQPVSQPVSDDLVGFNSSARPPDPGGLGGLGGLGTGVTSAMVAGAVVMVLVAALFGGVVGALVVSRRDSANVSLPVAPAGSTARPTGSIADIAARALPSVVTIRVKGADSAGTGSGFVLRKDGYILTNNHVVDGAAKAGKITVIFTDGKVSDAKVIGRDASYDLAVIRVDRRDLPVLAFGVSSTVVVGDPVIAVGAPLGLDSTVTSGIISALNRPVTPGGSGSSTAAFINAIQTDAAINPGNSGGPLLDMAGRVIGVNSAIARVAGSQNPADGQSGNIGVGFAIPSDQARKTAEQLIATGKATHPVIGVMLDTTYDGGGVKIATGSRNGSPPITKGGPADKAGLRPGDVIIKFDGRPVVGPDEFVVAIRAKSVGDAVMLTIRRGTSERTVKMTLQAAN